MASVGRYRLVEPLGAGAFATVWRAWDDELSLEVAVKVLADNWSLDSDVRHRFLAEARLLRRISSDLVVRVHDIGEADGRPYFVMDLVAGGTIAGVEESVPAVARLRLAADCARAVDAVHRAGVAHRDIKPSNILVDRTTGVPRIVVVDLGTAKSLADGTGFTMTAGTPAYMAPEQAMGGRIDERCDVYSLGVVAFELLAGRLPHETSAMPTDRPPPERIAARLGLPASLDVTLRSALAVDPRRRPRDAAALAELLERDAEAAGGEAGREWPVAWVGAVALLVAALSGAAAWWLG